MSTPIINAALRKRFCAPEWACFFEVAQGTGATSGRYADAIAMNLFPSRGLRVHGVEVKASRGDWLRELKDPTKADAIVKYCDHWWIATLPKVVLDGELPPTWGLLELSGGVLRQKVAAPKLTPVDMTRPFIAALLRRASEFSAKDLREAVRKETDAARAGINERVDRAIADRSREFDGLKRVVAQIEEVTGDKVESWSDGHAIGHAVKMVRKLGIHGSYANVASTARAARRFADEADNLLIDTKGEFT